MIPRGTNHAAQAPVLVSIWRDGKTLELTLEAGKMGVRLSQLEMPEALTNYKESKLSEEDRFVALARDHSRDQFGKLIPLSGTRAEVQAIAKVFSTVARGRGTIRVLLGEQATRTNLFEAARSPRYLHLATHGIAEGGRRVWDSALATTMPKKPTPEDYGFLTLKDLLGNWQGRLEGTELVTLSACRTARGRAETGEGFVALTRGFMFAGPESVVPTLWNVNDVSTSILMKEFYRNLV